MDEIMSAGARERSVARPWMVRLGWTEGEATSVLAKITILSGRHAGAVKTLTLGAASIGSSMAADIVLTDPSVAPLHARLVCGRFRFELEAIDGPILVGSHELAAGEKIKGAYPVRFFVGDVEAQCRRVYERGAMVLDRKFFGAASGILLLCAAFWTAFFNASHSSQSLRQSIGEAGVAAEKTPSDEMRPKPETAQAAAIALQQHLASLGLHSIDISAGQGVILARGFIAKPEENAWRAAQLWFDGSFGRELMLQSEVAVSQPKTQTAPIGIEAVWAGKRPYLIDNHGDKYFEGSFLKDGWIVEKIEEGRVLLRRNQERLSLEL